MDILTIGHRQDRGIPLLFTAVGYEAWNLGAKTPITRDVVSSATKRAMKELDQSFFKLRFDRLTKREKDYLFAMNLIGTGPQRSGDIADALFVKVSSIAPIRSSLIRKGMIYSPSHGDKVFTVPLFDGFLQAVQSKLGICPAVSKSLLRECPTHSLPHTLHQHRSLLGG